MEAKNYQLQNILNGSHQYMVPIYQRQYSWRKPEWNQLWSDVAELVGAREGEHHFLGSMVSKSLDAKAGGITRFLLIDGQQRMTTITILLAAMRDILKGDTDPQKVTLAQKLDELYLTNRFELGDNRYKVLPTKADRDPYMAIVDGATFDTSSPVGEAYRWFKNTVEKTNVDDPDFELSNLVNSLVGNVEIVSITLSEDDNDYRIFESLNATGTPLSQTDLLRNFFLMRFDGNDQERIYQDIVQPITVGLNDVDGASSDTMFQYALQRTGEYVRDKDVYAGWKRRCAHLSTEQLEATLVEIQRDANNYLKIADPSREPHADVQQRLRRYRQLGIMTPTPFLLNAMRWREDGDIDDKGLCRILDLIQSFLVRRMFSSIPTNALNRIFIRLAEQLPEDVDQVTATHQALSQPGLRWPTDEQFAERFGVYPLYKDTRPDQRRMVLQVLEEALGHKEGPALSELTIEHIMPQTLTDDWRKALGDDADRVHQRWLHTVGNLSLTGYNSELYNDPFEKKRVRYRDSNVQITKQIAEYEVWDEDSIHRRADWLLAIAMTTWAAPLPQTLAD